MKTLKFVCHQPAFQFKNTESGILCKTCTKTLIDYRDMSDSCFSRALKNRKPDETSCGIFRPDQVVINAQTRHSSSYLKIFGLIVLGFVFQKNYAQDTIKKEMDTTEVRKVIHVESTENSEVERGKCVIEKKKPKRKRRRFRLFRINRRHVMGAFG